MISKVQYWHWMIIKLQDSRQVLVFFFSEVIGSDWMIACVSSQPLALAAMPVAFHQDERKVSNRITKSHPGAAEV